MASPFGRPEEPPCECRDCTKSFRTVEQQRQETYRYSKSLSDTEAREVVKDALESIKDSWEWLFNQLDHNGDLIKQRWERKTRLERFFSLQTAMGDYVLPRDLILWRDNSVPSPEEEPARDRKALLLNYLTMNRLTIDPESFIGLLWSRTYYTPRQWAICDNQRLEWVWKSGSVKTDFSRLVLNINPFNSQYWELVSWQAGIFKQRLAIGFPRAILLLEAQQTIMTLLKNVVNDILNAGLPEVDHQEPFLHCNLLKYASEDELWCSYLNQPFTGPRCFGIPYIANTMALTRSVAVAYHLRCLQTNPEYLQRMVFQISAALGAGLEEDGVLRQTVAEISYDIWNYWSWKLIISACKNIIQQRVGFNTAKSSRDREIWFLKTQAAFLEFSILLNEQLEDRASYLPLLLSSRDSFSRYFKRNDENHVVLNEEVLEEARDDDLFPLLWNISNIARSRHPTEVDVDTALALLEDRVRRKKIARDRMDERVYSCLSDLGAIHDFKSKLAVRRPAPDRTLARRFIKDGNIEASGYRILLNRMARKVRDTGFKNFDLPKAGAPSKGLRRFLKAMKLQKLRAEGLIPDGENRVKLTLGTFWYMIRFQRHWLFENGVRQKTCQWTAEEIENDLNHISILIEGIGRPRIRPKEQEEILGDIEIPELTQPAVLPQNRNSSPDRDETLSPSAEFAWKTILGAKPDMNTPPANNPLKEVIITVKETWALIFKLAWKSSEEQQNKVHWKTFLIFMEDLVCVRSMSRSLGSVGIDQSLTITKGFSARTSIFDCIFEPMFAKRVLVGKGQGNNVGEWNCGGAIDFRKPLPTGMLDGCMLKTMLGRLGNYFAENGIIVRFRLTHKGIQNGCTRIRRTERTALPMLEDWGEDEEEEEKEEEEKEEEEKEEEEKEEEEKEEEEEDDDGERDYYQEDEHYASLRKESEKLASVINQMQIEGKGVAGGVAKEKEEDDNSNSDVEMTDAGNIQEVVESAEEDLDVGMGRVAEIAHEAAATDLTERAVDSTAVPTKLRIKIKKSEAEKTQESQNSDPIDDKKSETKRKESSDGGKAEDIQQLAGRVDERQLRRKRTGNSQAEIQQEDTEDIVLSYNLRPRKRQKKV